jgi:hypothetical protein
MIVEAHYRDGSKQKLLAKETDTLEHVVTMAKQLNGSGVKHVRIVERDKNNRRDR